ncbi:MAG: glycyl-radical enzyme activating protein [Candidatus Korobacteraceae bacterium]
MHAGGSKGLIFDIQGHSIHDGPGTRTLVFLSGCPLRCAWCSNPEGLVLQPQLMYKPRLCKDCPARCVPGCPKGAARQSENGGSHILFDRVLCDSCDTMECVKVCYMRALQTSGKWYAVDELMRLFNRDRCYWGPEGGITLTGGEPLLQQEFVLNLLARCHDAGIAACVETSAYVPRTVLQAALPCIQWLFIDLKHMDSGRHRQGTGVPNELILDNLRWISRTNWPGRLVVRTPVVPGFNDTVANAEATAEFLAEIGLSEINLLPLHRLGASKYGQLGMSYEYAEQPAVGQEALEALAAVYREKAITCHLGSDTPF